MGKIFNCNVVIQAICIALLPPLWAVAAPYLSITTGSVALICAGLYAANGNQYSAAPKITAGLLAGDIWACIAVWAMDALSLYEDVELFLILCCLGFFAVIIASLCQRYVSCFAWLCGWAIGLTVMHSISWQQIGSLPFQLAISMIVGVWYVGVFFQWVHQKLCLIAANKKEEDIR